MPPVQPRTFVLVERILTIDNNDTVTVAGGEITEFLRVVGLIRSDKAITLNMYQGSGLSESLEYANPTVDISANTGEGRGKALDFPVVGKVCRVDVSNTSGSTATLSVYLAAKGI